MAMLETTHCHLCGRDEFTALFPVRDGWFHLPGEFTLGRCRNCGLVYLNPRPQEQDMHQYYPDNYPPFSQQGDQAWLERTWERFLGLFRADLHLFKDAAGGRLLDVGCGSGKYLEKMKARGWSVSGVDVSALAAAEARKKGLDIFTGSLKGSRQPAEHFDAVVLMHVLEHIHEPGALLDEVHRILKQDGRLVIEVPNFGSWEARLFGACWSAIDPPRHLFLFTPATLGKLLERSGFVVERVGYNPTPVSLARSFQQVLGTQPGAGGKSPAKYLAYLWLPFTAASALLGRGGSVMVQAHKREGGS